MGALRFPGLFIIFCSSSAAVAQENSLKKHLQSLFFLFQMLKPANTEEMMK